MSCTILVGDVLARLAEIPDRTFQTCVTSPPYWGLRDYGVAGQIGLEPTPEAFVARMVGVFREVRRTMKDDGSLWLNLGDSYRGALSDHRKGGSFGKASCIAEKTRSGIPRSGRKERGHAMRRSGIKPKDLVGIPWRVAFALQADGWYLRSDIIWHKPNPMPESVQDRPTKAHEYLFLLSKSERYFYDAVAIKEPVALSSVGRLNQNLDLQEGSHRANGGAKTNGTMKAVGSKENRNKRSVWTVPTYAFKEAHFATFPPALITPCILAGSRPGDAVLDPFGGSGTTGMVALEHGRRATLIELNPEYAAMAERRCLNITPGLGL